jgi:hypothetical protein
MSEDVADIWIDCVAIKIEDVIYFLPRPYRHDNVVHRVFDILGDRWQEPEVQGFLTNKGDFVLRKDALAIALAAGQVVAPLGLGELHSEEMW